LSGRELRWIPDEGREHPRLVYAGVPKRDGEGLATPENLAQRLDVFHRDAVRVVRRDRIPRHAFARGPGAVTLQPFERELDLICD